MTREINGTRGPSPVCYREESMQLRPGPSKLEADGPVGDHGWAVAGQLQSLESERYALEDRVKGIALELQEINKAHSDRCMVLIEERKKATARVREILDEAEQLRRQKTIK